MGKECDLGSEPRPDPVRFEKKYVNLEYHPADSRIRIVDHDICQSLTQRMGTGGGNVPLILEIHEA